MIIKVILMMVVVNFKLVSRKLCENCAVFVGILLYLLNIVCCQNSITFSCGVYSNWIFQVDPPGPGF